MSHKAYAKVNIFLKITGKRGNYHTLASRFMRVENLYDELEFIPNRSGAFLLEGDFSCQTKQNTIYKAYEALLAYTNDPTIEEFFQEVGVGVEKRIPAFAGLGGGSSDAATFLHMCNDALDLGLGRETLATIGMQVGADVAFFVHGFKSANVMGIGECVERFNEEPLQLELFTPKIEISTPAVYQRYRERFFNPVSFEKEKKLLASDSCDVLNTMTREDANDLYAPACELYPELDEYAKEGWFFSGSGSSFFRAF